MTSPPSPAVRADLVPQGVLRVGLNMSNFLLVNFDMEKDHYHGIVPDLARELGKRLEVPVRFVPYSDPGKVTAAAANNEWDVAFLADEPARATEINFTAAYVEIQSTYLVPAGSPLKKIADVDQPGIRIASYGSAAYDLYLTRTLKHATLLREANMDASFKRFVEDQLDALAGLRPRLESDAQKLPGAHLLEGGFQAVQQAMGTPRNRTVGADYLRSYADEVKRTGRVAQAIREHNVKGVTVAA